MSEGTHAPTPRAIDNAKLQQFISKMLGDLGGRSKRTAGPNGRCPRSLSSFAYSWSDDLRRTDTASKGPPALPVNMILEARLQPQKNSESG